MTLHLPDDAARAGEAFVAEAAMPADGVGRDGVTLLAPHRFLAGVLPAGRTPQRLPRSVALRVLRLYLGGLLALEEDSLCERQADLAATAVRSLLSAAVVQTGADQGLGTRRRASLLDEVVLYIDGALGAPLSAETLCEALGCSRSALYRAAAPLGGAAELIFQRRLLAVRDRLADPAERRPIAAVAAAHGLRDAAQFSRRFKAMFGLTPSEVRRGGPRPGDAARRREPRSGHRLHRSARAHP